MSFQFAVFVPDSLSYEGRKLIINLKISIINGKCSPPLSNWFVSVRDFSYKLQKQIQVDLSRK